MVKSNARARWSGTIKDGEGIMTSNNYPGSYNFVSRFENGKGTSPEELIGAAHAGCFSMYLSLLLTEENLNPKNVETAAVITLDKDDIGPSIIKIDLDCKVECDGLSNEKLQELAALAKIKCPVSRLYAGGTAVIALIVSLV